MKKVAAIIFLLLATVLVLYTIARLPLMIGILISDTPSGDRAYAIGYWIGHIGSWLIIFAIIYFLSRYGIKWLKSPRVRQSSSTILDEDFSKE